MRLLLHICCGVCALYPVESLKASGVKEIVGYYYNPNIHPPSEYKRRMDTLVAIESRLNIKIIYPTYNMEEFFRQIVYKEDREKRCPICWRLRLEATAKFAVENGFDAFTTTLLVSPYQDQEAIKDIGRNVSAQKGIEFYYEDFRKGFNKAHQEAKVIGIYMQKYCGCVFSELERVKLK